MRKRAPNRNSIIRNLLRHPMNLLQPSTTRSERPSNLLHKHRTRNPTSTNLPTPSPPNTAIVCHNDHLGLNPRRLRLLNRHAEIKHIPRVVHDNHQHALALLDPLQDASSDLLRAGRGEDRSCYGAGEQAWAHEGCKGGFVACSAA
jgi:hypothetical protein